jgi:hypothetical protein
VAAAILAAVTLVLFPFDWLQQVWPAYAQLFDRIFVSAREHAVGHATLFFIAGLLALWALPALRTRPLRYALVMAVGALGEEALQALSKRQVPNLGDGRDLLFDLLGFTLAYLAVALWRWARASVSVVRPRDAPTAKGDALARKRFRTPPH